MLRNPIHKNKLHSTLIVIILATLPCYLMGMIVLWIGNSIKSQQNITPTVTLTATLDTWGGLPTATLPPIPTSPAIDTPAPTMTLTPTATITYTIPTNTPTDTPTITPTISPTFTPTISPTFTSTVSTTSTGTATETPISTEITAAPDITATP